MAWDKYRVPHYLPGANPLLDEFATLHNILRWTIEAGTETMSPDFTERTRVLRSRGAEYEFNCCRSLGLKRIPLLGKAWERRGVRNHLLPILLLWLNGDHDLDLDTDIRVD